MSTKKITAYDDRASCWWCRFWMPQGKCSNYVVGKMYAVADGTLHRCPSFKRRISPLPPEIGLCSKCGCQINTDLSGRWVPDPRNLELKLLLCNGCYQLIWDRAQKRKGNQ